MAKSSPNRGQLRCIACGDPFADGRSDRRPGRCRIQQIVGLRRNVHEHQKRQPEKCTVSILIRRPES